MKSLTAPNPMRLAVPSTGSLAGAAFLWALSWALSLAAFLGILRWLLAAFQDIQLDPAWLTFWAMGWCLFFFVLLFAGRMLWVSRRVADAAFTCTGFLTTFFGLAMLVIFFVELGAGVADWFRWTPRLIELQNQKLTRQLEDIQKNAQHLKDVQYAKVLKEMNEAIATAATEDEKKEFKEMYETDIIPKMLEDLEKTLPQQMDEAKKGMRSDLSTSTLFLHFLTEGPSYHPQDAGIWTALLGSLWLSMITVIFAVPVGVGAALYLEEYKNSGWLGYIIQININNLAGVPSVVFGILGAFVFVEMIFKPLHNEFPMIEARNVLGGGLTLGLLTLPVVIVSAQEAIRAVPSSIRQGAYALGATHWQVIWHQVLPLARPGILTGTILAMSRAIGEAAPLVMFGALLWVHKTPTLFSQFAILPMQIFGWTDKPGIPVEGHTVEAWKNNAALASLVLMVVLLSLNAVAIYLRNRAQKRVRV